MKKTKLEYRLELDRILKFYRDAPHLPEVRESYDQYVNMILMDSGLDHYEKSELFLYWRGEINDDSK